MSASAELSPLDSRDARKARGAFFTPPSVAKFIARWAVQDGTSAVLEPSAGDAVFLVEAVRRLSELSDENAELPQVNGVEIHAASAQVALERVASAGGRLSIKVSDFFLVEPEAAFDAVIGNPPFIRYQEFSGDGRRRAREAALRAGVALSGLASSWAAFVVHSTLFLREGGRLGLVLPAELLSVNYASPVRSFLFQSFASVELVMFEEQIFADAEADVVLLLASGRGRGPVAHATVHMVRDAGDLEGLGDGARWTPEDPADKWTSLLVDPEACEPLRSLRSSGAFGDLERWGDTTLGIVTGNNRYFAMSPQRRDELGLSDRDVLKLVPPGSSHLRGLEFSESDRNRLGEGGASTWLFRPQSPLSEAASRYISQGHATGVDQAYKCRVRRIWHQVPIQPVADLFLTCMNADVPRIAANAAAALHLNSVHGIYLRDEFRELGLETLPLVSLNSVTLLHGEVVGRSYGGGVLKIEPREADRWAFPSPEFVESRRSALREVRPQVADVLGRGELPIASKLVDEALFGGSQQVSRSDLHAVRSAHSALQSRRSSRGKSGR